MAEETVVLKIEIISDSIKGLEAQLKKANDELKGTVKNTENFKVASGNVAILKNEIKILTNESKKLGAEQTKETKIIENFNKAMDNQVKSIGDMQREVRALLKTDTKNMTAEQIDSLNAKIGKLKNDVQDARAYFKAMDKDEIFNNIGQGLRGAVAGVQLLTAGLQAFGIESESIKKVEKTTMALISATQAMTVISELRQKQVLKALANQIKEIAANTIQTVQTWAQVTATNAATAAEANKAVIMGKASIVTKAVAAAQWLWNSAMAANPIGILIVGVAALVTGVAALAGAFNTTTTAQRVNNEVMKEFTKISAEPLANLEKLSMAVNNTVKGTKEHTEAVKEYNKYAEANNLTQVGYNDTLLQTIRVTEQNRKALIDSLMLKAKEATLMNALIERETLLQKIKSGDAGLVDAGKGKQLNETIEQLQKELYGIKDLKIDMGEVIGLKPDIEKNIFNIGTSLNKIVDVSKELNHTKETQIKLDEQIAILNEKLAGQVEKLIQSDREKVISDAKTSELKLEVLQVEVDEEINILTDKIDATTELENQFTEWKITNLGTLEQQEIAANKRKLDNTILTEEQIRKEKEKSLDTAAHTTNTLSNIVNTAMDMELMKVGDNEAKKTAIKKKYATTQAVIAIAEIGINTAKAVMSVAPVIPLMILEGVLGAVQIAAAVRQKNQIMAAAAGGGTFRTSKPTLMMFGDNPGGVEEISVKPISGKGTTSINPSSGLIAMAGGGTVTTGTTRVNTSNSYNEIKDAIIEGMRQSPAPLMDYKEFTTFQEKSVRTKQRANL